VTFPLYFPSEIATGSLLPLLSAAFAAHAAGHSPLAAMLALAIFWTRAWMGGSFGWRGNDVSLGEAIASERI
jgi:hypothetical protein